MYVHVAVLKSNSDLYTQKLCIRNPKKKDFVSILYANGHTKNYNEHLEM